MWPFLALKRYEPIATQFHFNFFIGNDENYFSIDPATGKLFAIKQIDREDLENDEFLLELEATQRDNPLKSGTTKVKNIFTKKIDFTKRILT